MAYKSQPNKLEKNSVIPDENIDGAALHKDLSFTDYKFTQPDSFTYKGETYRSKSFADIYIQTLELLIRDYPKEMANLPEKYVWFKYEPSGSSGGKQLSNGIYAGMNYHRSHFVKFLQKIFDDLGLPRDTMFIDSHRDYQGYSHDKNRISKSSQTEKTVLRLNDDWSYKRPLSYTLKGKQTKIESEKWIDLYISVLEDLIRISPGKMRNLPYNYGKNFAYNDFPIIRFRVLSNGIRAAANLQAYQIEEMLRQLLSYLYIAPSEFEVQAINDKRDVVNVMITSSASKSSSVNKYNSLSVEEGFYQYLKNEKNMAESSCRSFISSIHSAEKYAIKNNYSSTVLFTENFAEAEMTNKKLTEDPDFREFDKEKRFRFSNALSKLMTFLRIREGK